MQLTVKKRYLYCSVKDSILKVHQKKWVGGRCNANNAFGFCPMSQKFRKSREVYKRMYQRDKKNSSKGTARMIESERARRGEKKKKSKITISYHINVRISHPSCVGTRINRERWSRIIVPRPITIQESS